jgi:hypothetical protein
MGFVDVERHVERLVPLLHSHDGDVQRVLEDVL